MMVDKPEGGSMLVWFAGAGEKVRHPLSGSLMNPVSATLLCASHMTWRGMQSFVVGAGSGHQGDQGLRDEDDRRGHVARHPGVPQQHHCHRPAAAAARYVRPRGRCNRQAEGSTGVTEHQSTRTVTAVVTGQF